MAKREKEINGKKILYKYGPGCWLTIVLSLAVIAVPILLMFVFPFFTSTFEGKVFNVTGLHTILQLFQRNPNEISTFLNYSRNVSGWSWLADAPGPYIIIAMGAVLIISLVLAFVIAIITICYLLGGKLSHRKGPFTMSIWVFVTICLFCTFPITMMVVELVKGINDAVMHYLYNLIMVGASLLLMILLYVVYAVFMKNRIYFSNTAALEEYKKRLSEKQNKFPGVLDAPGVVAAPAGTPIPPVQIIINTAKGTTAQVNENGVDIVKSSKQNEVLKEKKEPPQVQQFIIQQPPIVASSGVVKANIDIPRSTDFIGGHAFAKNTTLQVATIPSGIKELGNSAFANCVNLRIVSIPASVKKIGYNCFFNCCRLESINYQGTKKEWGKIIRGSNWLSNAGTTFVVCRDAKLAVDPLK